MDKERMAELEKIESHGAENGWVAPMAEEDKAYFAYFRSVFKRYNISPSKATRLEYDFVTRVQDSTFHLHPAYRFRPSVQKLIFPFTYPFRLFSLCRFAIRLKLFQNISNIFVDTN